MSYKTVFMVTVYKQGTSHMPSHTHKWYHMKNIDLYGIIYNTYNTCFPKQHIIRHHAKVRLSDKFLRQLSLAQSSRKRMSTCDRMIIIRNHAGKLQEGNWGDMLSREKWQQLRTAKKRGAYHPRHMWRKRLTLWNSETAIWLTASINGVCSSDNFPFLGS